MNHARPPIIPLLDGSRRCGDRTPGALVDAWRGPMTHELGS